MAETCEEGKLYGLGLPKLIPDLEKPHKFFEEHALAELQASISSNGVIQTIYA